MTRATGVRWSPRVAALLSTAVAASLVAAACGGDDGSTGPADVQDVGGADSFDSDASTAPTGEDAATSADANGSAGADAAAGVDAATVPSDAGSAGVEVVDPPDGFPGPDTSSCPPGTPCLLARMQFCDLAVCNGLGQCVAAGRQPGCCVSDDDCADTVPTHACEQFFCQAGQCVGRLTPGCCAVDDECDDGIPCTTDTCSIPGASCAHCPWSCACPGEPATWTNPFEGLSMPAAGWNVTDFQPSDDVTWRLSDRRFVSPPTSAWLGRSTCPTYHGGALDADCQPLGASVYAVRAEMKSLPFALPGLPGGYVALFWVWADVEPVQGGSGAERDVLTVLVEDQLTFEIWPLTTSLVVGKSTSGLWRQMGVDLSPWKGQQVRLIFSFDSLDATDNHHEGVYVDDITVVPRCAEGCCEVDADCGDVLIEDPCTEARCVAMSDGSGGICQAVPKAPGGGCDACTDEEAAACDDNNPCTTDLCGEEGVCLHEPFCCFEQAVREDSFEAGLSDWFVTDAAPGDGVTWTTSATTATDGELSAWLGNPITGHYEAADDELPGDAIHASLTTTAFILPEVTLGSSVGATFWLQLSTEWDGQPLYDNPLGVDVLKLEIIVASKPTTVWTSDDVQGTTDGQWVPITVPLQEWAGNAAQLRFTFDTLDGNNNAFGGPRIDDLRVGRLCPTD